MSAERRAQVLVVGAIVAAVALVGIYLAAGGSSYAPAEDPGPVQAPLLAQPRRAAADRRAVHALGPRRRRLPARGQPRDPGPGPGHARVPRTLHGALRHQRRQAGKGGAGRPAARGRRRRRSRRPQPAPRGPPARNPAEHPARPGDRTDQQRRIPARQRPGIPRAQAKVFSNSSCPKDRGPVTS